MRRRTLIVVSMIALAMIVPAGSAYGIEVCYDYAIWRLTGNDPRPPLDATKKEVPRTGTTGPGDLMAELQKKKYEKVEPTPKGTELRADDVVIIPGHVGYVTAPNAIDHFVQVEGTTVRTTKTPVGGFRYPPRNLPRDPTKDGRPLRGGVFEGDTLQTFMTVRPYAAATTYEVWRQAKGSTFVGAWKCQRCDLTIVLNSDGTGVWDDRRGGPPGSLYASGKFPATWTASADAVTFTIPREYGNRSGTTVFRLSDGKLRDPWGNVYAR